MRPVHWLFVLRVASLLALSVSVALLLDYLSPQMAFCSTASGCGKVRDSGLGYILLPGGILFPFLPVLGVLNFLALFFSSLLRRPDWRRNLLIPLGLATGIGGFALLGLQAAAVGAFCFLCVIVDVSAVVVSVAVWGLRGTGWESALADETSDSVVEEVQGPLSEGQRLHRGWKEDSELVAAPNPPLPRKSREALRLRTWGWMSLLGLSLAAPLIYPKVAAPPEVPPSILELYDPGSTNVVEFFDYQCPHCRVAIPEIEQALASFEHPVHVEKKPVFLPHHPLGKKAARLHVCAAEQGEAETVFETLLGAGDLTEEMIEEAAQQLEDQKALQQCLDSPRPDQKLAATLERLKKADFVGLPTTYIGPRRLLGAQSREVYLEALLDAAEGENRGLPPFTYWGAVSILALALIVASRVRPRSALRS